MRTYNVVYIIMFAGPCKTFQSYYLTRGPMGLYHSPVFIT